MNGLFVGLTTLDFLYLVAQFPRQNEKIVALDTEIAAGGPATNAAITFQFLGNRATLLSMIGHHPLTSVIRHDLETHQIRHLELDPHWRESPAVSSVIVTQNTGERAVISLNATKSQAKIDQIPPNILTDIDIVLIDGHQMAISPAIAEEAKKKNIPIVLDGGSWKPGLEQLLPWVDYAICSANFFPPHCSNSTETLNYLVAQNIPYIAITKGDQPIQYYTQAEQGEIYIPNIKAVDTLGAGDIFHGAFCHFILENIKDSSMRENDLIEGLTSAAKIASRACQSFGTRNWMKENP
ncbi:MAG: sugar kinase [Snowella sp.]|nr:sugar kinase [Snowella sp.]